MDIERLIRDVPDFPKKGILFKDITTLISDANGFKKAIELFVEKHRGEGVDKVIGIESRGFIFGAPLALELGCGFVPVRKPGKLPYESIREEYELEYGKNTLEIHIDSVRKGERVIIVDDLLATGGTALATANLVSKLEGNIISLDFLIELEFLKGREKLKNYTINSFLKY